MELPPNLANPLFMAELALEMKMPVGELGQRMSNYELCVFWPAYFSEKARHQEQENAKRDRR